MDGITAYNDFLLKHKPQLVISGIPEIFWPVLCKKLQNEIFDSSSWFQLVRIDYDDDEKKSYDPSWGVMALRDIDKSDFQHIYLVDHAWTFKVHSIKSNLRNIPGLLDRMARLMQVTSKTIDERIEEVCKNIWKYAQAYSISGSQLSAEDTVPVWYVLDEFGSGLTHSDDPNFRAVPFMKLPDQVTYTVIFPIKDIEEGDLITRNMVEGTYSDPLQREAMLIPWKHYEYFYEDFNQKEPGVDYFLEGHLVESLPNLQLLNDRKVPKKLKVFSEYRFINEYLTSPKFEIVDNEDEADILWYLDHFRMYKEFSENSPNKFVNQFPFEFVVTIKDLLAIVSRRCSEKYPNTDDTSPPWLPTTFNMKTELAKLVSYYMKRKELGLDNHWICKPYNLARGLDTYITDNLNFLCVLPSSGPKIAQKYIENPVLFERPDVGRVKFDVRYVILLKSVNQTEVYIYKNFFLRFANKSFDLNEFDDYEKHFTVMNYSEDIPLYKLLCHEFKDEWSKQYEHYKWVDIEKSIFKAFSELFVAATSKEPPCGIAKSPQSRALYAADVMLSWDKDIDTIQPKLLEINWMPDCKRACEYYPNFYNDIFSAMFLNEDVDTCVKIL